MSKTLLCIATCLGLLCMAHRFAAGQAPARPEAALVPPPAARVVPKWEYKVLTEGQINVLGKSAGPQSGELPLRLSFADEINGLGAEGWELVAVNTGERPAIYHFKRPKP